MVNTWAGLSDGGTELLAGDDDPFLIDDDLSEATVDSDDDDDDEVVSSTVPHDGRRRSVWPFCRRDVNGASDPLGPSTVGELAIAFSSSRAPLSTSSQPSKSLLGAVDRAWWPAGGGAVGFVVVDAVEEVSVATESNRWSRLFN